MKGLILALMMVGTAQAGTFYPVQTPPSVVTFDRFYLCSAQSVNADDTVQGLCQAMHSGACSGRGCQPVTYSTYFDVQWSSQGDPLSVTECGKNQYHYPGLNAWQYENGYTAANCHAFKVATGYQQIIDGNWYWINAVAVDGSEELVFGRGSGWIYAF